MSNYWNTLRQRKISRRTMLGASAKAGVGVAGLALVGCGDDDEPDAGAVAAERAAAAAEEAAAAAVAAGEARAADSEAAAATAAGAADAAADAADAAGEASAAAADAADAAGEASAAASQAASAADAAAALAAEAAESEDAANAAAAAEAAAAAAAQAADAASAAGDAAAAAVADAAAQAAEAAAQAARDVAAAVEAGTATAAAAQAAIDNAAEAAAAAAAAAGEASAAAEAAASTAAATAAAAVAAAEEAAEAAAETAAAAVAAAEEAADAAQEAADTAATAAESASAAQATAAAALRGPRVRIPTPNFGGTEAGTGTNGNDHAMLWCLYDPLVSYDASLTPQPDRSLAQSWETPDPLNVIFSIRENVQFHDGLPLTAEAVRLWIERGKTLEASTIKGDLAAVGSVEETDTMTAAFRMDRPFSPLLWILGDRAGLILSPNSFDDFTELNNRNTPVGTGAHVFVEESLDGPFVMDANPNYWKPNAPHIEGVTFNAGEDATFGATNALLAGDYDAIRFPAEEDHDRIRDAGYELIIQPSNTTGFYNMNTNIEPWNNPHARHAFNAGFDRTELNDTVFGGYHTPALWGWYGPSVIYHDPNERFWEFDPEVVQMHLAAGGFEDGLEFNMNVKADDPLYIDQSLFVQAALAQVGITMNIDAKPHPAFWSEWYAEEVGGFMGGMSMRGDIWQQVFWNVGEGGPHDHMLPPDKDPEVQAALVKVEETFELQARIEAMRELNRVAESRSYQVKTVHYKAVVAHDPGLQFELFGDVKFHFGQDDVRWAT